MSKKINIISRSTNKTFAGKTRFSHWQIDNQVYFITARCRDRFPAFATDGAKRAFWDRFTHWTREYGFVPWVTTLVGNHYHTLGYLKEGKGLGQMMRKLHGSTAKLVNGLLPARRRPFWRERGGRDYFDGCIRDELQCRRAYRYVLWQCRRHGICGDWKNYPHTRVAIELERGMKRAIELGAFLYGVGYPRYDRKKRGRGL